MTANSSAHQQTKKKKKKKKKVWNTHTNTQTHKHAGVLHTHKKEWVFARHNNINGPRGITLNEVKRER